MFLCLITSDGGFPETFWRVTCCTLLCRDQRRFFNCQWMWIYNTNLSWMLHHVHHWTISWCTQWSCLTVPSFLMLCLWLTVWASKWLWSGGALCACCIVYRLSLCHCIFLFELETYSSVESNISFVILLNEESLMEFACWSASKRSSLLVCVLDWR